MQRGLLKVSRYSYGCWVIGPCLYIKHGSVLTSHRSSGLDVLGWNSMLDRVRNTHCSAPGKKKSLVYARRQPQLHPDVQIIHRLFLNCLLWHANAALQKWFWWDVSTWDKSEWQRVGKKNILWELWVCMGQREGYAGWGVWKWGGFWQCAGRLLLQIRPLSDSVINVLLRKK